MEFVRLFTALRPPENILDHLLETQAGIRGIVDHAAVRWTGRENLHLTFQFLGDTPRERIADIVDAMSAGVSRIAAAQPVQLAIGGAGTFPRSGRPRVIWIGVEDSNGLLGPLHAQTSRELRERGFALDRKPFRPHITLGYVQKRATRHDLQVLSEAVANSAGSEGDAVSFEADRLVLVQSTLTSAGAIYRDLHSVVLSAASSSTSSGDNARE